MTHEGKAHLWMRKNIQGNKKGRLFTYESGAGNLKVITFALIGCDFSTDILTAEKLGMVLFVGDISCILEGVCCSLTVPVSLHHPTHYF